MHNALIRGGTSSGLWVGIVASGEWETFDQRQFESINGDLGGVWAPAAQIELGGAGLLLSATLDTGASCVTTLDGDVQFPNGFTCTGTATVTFTANSVVIGSGGELTAHCASHFNGDTTFGAAGNVTMTAGTGVFQCNKNTQFTHNVGVTALLTCSLGLRVATGDTNLESPTYVSGPMGLSNSLTLGGKGRISWRLYLEANASQTFGVASGTNTPNGVDEVIRQGVGTASTWKITSTDAVAGSRIELSSFDSFNAVSVTRDDNSVICKLKSGAFTSDGAYAAPPTGFYAWVILVYNGASWMVKRGWSA